MEPDEAIACALNTFKNSEMYYCYGMWHNLNQWFIIVDERSSQYESISPTSRVMQIPLSKNISHIDNTIVNYILSALN